jgi:1-acyl-sn-glycerol-3-phosphate acyltransferase
VPSFTRAYRIVIDLTTPIIVGWSRLEVVGADLLPLDGPLLLVGNHDSYWDPIAVAVAARHRRQIRALAKSTIWKVKPVAMMMDGMGQIPVHRGQGDAAAMQSAIDELGAGACIGIFPEGTRSLGRELRAHSGAGRLVLAVPSAEIVCVRVTGAVDVVRVPRRPRIRVEFFHPSGPRVLPNETASELSARLLAEIRQGAPRAVAGSHRRVEKRSNGLSIDGLPIGRRRL